MKKIGIFIFKEIRKVAPATILFLFLLHMIALTKAVSVGDYSFVALRATTATIGALIIAKAILIVEALPIARLFSGRLAILVLWKTLLFGSVVLLFRFVEEIVPLALRHGGLVVAIEAMLGEIFWPLFWVLTMWVLGGLLFYCLASELVRAVGPGKVKEILFANVYK